VKSVPSRKPAVRVSARNRLSGTVVAVKLGDVVAQVTIRVGRQIVDAVITRDSAEELALERGDRVAALIKSTEVMVLKEV
jgi:molybdopterin-binding protein